LDAHHDELRGFDVRILVAFRIGQAQQLIDVLHSVRDPALGRMNPLLFHVDFSLRLPLGERRDYAIRWGATKWGTAVIPFTPLRTAAESRHEESVSYVAKNQRLGRICALFTNGV
jgi:hypothetical protein